MYDGRNLKLQTCVSLAAQSIYTGSKEMDHIANPKNTSAALGKMPGSEVTIVSDLAPSCDVVRHKCSEMHMHSSRAPKVYIWVRT